MTYKYRIAHNYIQLGKVTNEVTDQESEKIYNNFYNYMNKNISVDIKKIKNDQIKYLDKPFLRVRNEVNKKNLSNSNKNIFVKINKKNEKTLKEYIRKNEEFLERISSIDFDEASVYEYYQSKLDWYTVTPERVNDFVRGLADSSEIISKISRWTEEMLDNNRYEDTVKIRESNISYEVKV